MKRNDGKSILIIDDDIGIRKGFGRLLAEEGYQVESAANGRSAMSILADRRFDLVLTDLVMPEMGGLEVIKHMRSTSPGTRVLLMTAYSTIQAATRALSLGASGYLTKPFDWAELKQVIAKHLETTPAAGDAVAAGPADPDQVSTEALLGSMLNLVLDMAARELDADDGTIMILDPARQMLTVRAAFGKDQETLLGQVVPVAVRDSLAHLKAPVYLEGSPIQDPRMAGLRRFVHPRFGHCIAVADGNALLGILTINRSEKQRVFTENDRRVAGLFAKYAATTIENTLAKQKLEEAYAKVVGSQDRLTELDRFAAIGRTVAGAAHDLVNPITGILGCVELLKQSVSKEEPIYEDIESISQATEHCKGIATNLLNFARRSSIPRGGVQVLDIMENSLELLHHQLLTRRIRVQSRLPVRLPAVYGNASELKQVVLNIVQNAMDAVEDGGVLTFSGEEIPAGESPLGRDTVVLSFRDNGVGMSSEVLGHIFEMFYTTKGDKGNGLGLANSKEIIESHGGALTVDSKEGEGTVFHVMLPAQRSTIAEIPPHSPKAAKMRILIVDDEKLVRETISRMIGRMGHDVVDVGCGEDALKRLQESCYDLMMTDWNMPGMNGLELADSAKRLAPGTPVLLFTGWDTEILSGEKKNGTLDMVLQKPVTYAELESALNQVAGFKACESGLPASKAPAAARAASPAKEIDWHPPAPCP